MMGKSLVRKNLPVAALGLAAFGLGAGAVTLGNGDAVVERGFERAIASMDAAPDAKKARPVVAGSEEFWLTHVVHDNGFTAGKPLAVGDRITINSNGTERVLNVVDVDRLDSQVLRISSERPMPLLLVTCQDASGQSAHPVRFLIEADEDLQAVPPGKQPRSLKVAPAA